MQELTQTEIDWIRKNSTGKTISVSKIVIGWILTIVGLGCMVSGFVGKFVDGDINGKELLRESGFVVLLGAFLLITYDYRKYRGQVHSVLGKLASTLRDANSDLGNSRSG